MASTPASRLLGLAHLDRERAGSGLLLERCGSVHTFGMRFALDLVFFDAAGVPLRADLGVPSRALRACRAAKAVLELPVGSIPSLGGALERAGVEERVNTEPAHAAAEHGGTEDVAGDR